MRVSADSDSFCGLSVSVVTIGLTSDTNEMVDGADVATETRQMQWIVAVVCWQFGTLRTYLQPNNLPP